MWLLLAPHVIGRPTSCLHRLEARGKYIIVLQHFLKVAFDQDRQFQDNANSSTFYGPSLDEVWSFCLHMSCSPIDCSSRSRGGATPMQAKWIKLDLALYDVTYSKEMVASKKFCTPLYSPVRLLLIYHFYELILWGKCHQFCWMRDWIRYQQCKCCSSFHISSHKPNN